jgi:hypothetical protein
MKNTLFLECYKTQTDDGDEASKTNSESES